MRTSTQVGARFGKFAITAAALLLLVRVTPAAAQVDPRWQAWLGCWRLADPQRVVGAVVGAQQVCVIPAAGASAVDIVTLVNGQIIERRHVVGSGEQRASAQDGCTGWERAEWSPRGSRVYVRSEWSCPGGLKRIASGLFAISDKSEWLDIQSVAVGTQKGVRVLRFGESSDAGALPAEITAALAGHKLSSSTARLSAASSLTTGDVAEASQRLDASVVERWLVERHQDVGMKLDAKGLVQLADLGVSDRVIDVLVALSYPKAFAINPATYGAERVPSTAGRTASALRGGRALTFLGYDAYGFPIYDWDYSLRYGCSPYAYSLNSYFGYGYSPFGCSRYGFSPYGYGYGGYGYGYGYGYSGYGFYPGTQTVIVVRTQPPTTEAPHGRVVNGRGYQQGGSSTGGSAHPSSSVGSSGGSSATAASSAGSGSSSSSGRTAHPKP